MCRFSDVILQSSVLIVGRSVQCGRQRKPPHEVETTPMTYETLQQWFLNNREIGTFMCGRGSQKSKKESGDRGCKRFVGYWVYGSPQHLSRKIKTSALLMQNIRTLYQRLFSAFSKKTEGNGFRYLPNNIFVRMSAFRGSLWLFLPTSHTVVHYLFTWKRVFPVAKKSQI